MMEVESKQQADKSTTEGENKVEVICADSHGDICDSASLCLPPETLSFDSSSLE